MASITKCVDAKDVRYWVEIRLRKARMIIHREAKTFSKKAISVDRCIC